MPDHVGSTRLVLSKDSDELRRHFPLAEFALLAAVGHFPLEEEPRKANDILDTFFWSTRILRTGT
jgi:pimeloyl-ACP methyl ester carboxylesterase